MVAIDEKNIQCARAKDAAESPNSARRVRRTVDVSKLLVQARKMAEARSAFYEQVDPNNEFYSREGLAQKKVRAALFDAYFTNVMRIDFRCQLDEPCDL